MSNFNDLKEIAEQDLPLKDTLEVGDMVIIVLPEAFCCAYIAEIERDVSKKDEWWFVTFYMISLPPFKMRWILKTPQMTGKETFTMKDQERFFAPIDLEAWANQPPGRPVEDKPEPGLKIVQ